MGEHTAAITLPALPTNYDKREFQNLAFELSLKGEALDLTVKSARTQRLDI